MKNEYLYKKGKKMKKRMIATLLFIGCMPFVMQASLTIKNKGLA